MTPRLLLTTTAVLTGVLAPVATADAAKKATKYPSISKIAPMRASIGDTMTITGKNFVKGKQKNTVVFRRVNKRSVFVKADGLSTKRLRFVLPESLADVLGTKSGKTVESRFQIRVLARRFGKRYTSLKGSPVIAPAAAAGEPAPATPPAPTGPGAGTGAAAAAPAATVAAAAPAPPADCDGDGVADAAEADDDNDLLADLFEVRLGTGVCDYDSDDDGLEDGWEYQSALDLNTFSCPTPLNEAYPVPCAAIDWDNAPNPKDASDANTDFDGDWVPAWAEHAMWQAKAKADASYRTLTNMWYSDGKQSSVDNAVANTCRGVEPPAVFDGDEAQFAQFGAVPADVSAPQYAIYTLDRGYRNGDGCLDDNERDEDGDYLTNGEELGAEMSSQNWWTKAYQDEKPFQLSYRGTYFMSADTDKDGVKDGLDDQDHDDFLNVEEVVRDDPNPAPTNSDLWGQPFNPCLPAINSRTCPTGLPLGGDPWAPFEAGISTARPLYEATVFGYALYAHASILPPAHPFPRP